MGAVCTLALVPHSAAPPPVSGRDVRNTTHLAAFRIRFAPGDQHGESGDGGHWGKRGGQVHFRQL